jgi:aminopeptidase-like protein
VSPSSADADSIGQSGGGNGDPESRQYAMLWLLQMGDGTETLFDVTQRSGIAFDEVQAAADLLERREPIEWC